MRSSKEIEVKTINLNVMIRRIIEVEKENLKIRSKTETDMINCIRQIIMEESKKKY